MDFNFRLFEKSNNTPTSIAWYDFVFSYFICLGAMWTVRIVIENTFWFLPIFWYFGAKPIESAIKNYYVSGQDHLYKKRT